VRDLLIPRDTTAFGSMDWGSNAPGVLLLWVHVGDGHWHIARELKFQRETTDTVAERWRALLASVGAPRVSYIAADPSMWSYSGESIAESLQRLHLPLVKADNNRKNGWQRLHELLRPAPDGRPWLTIDVTCDYGRRILPAMQSDKTDPDDLDTRGDDHWCDAARYGAMSRFVAHRRYVMPAYPTMSPGWLKARADVPAGPLTRRH